MSDTTSKDGTVSSIWYSHCGYSPLALAIQQRRLQNDLAVDGIGLKSVKKDGDASERLSHYDHHLHNSFRQGGSVPAIWARARGGAVRLIGLNWLDEYQAVIALPESGIRTAKDLRGRRLGLPSGNHPVDHSRAANLRGFAVALESANLSWRKDVELVVLRNENSDFGGRSAEEDAAPREAFGGLAVDALKSGKVDAIFVRGAHGIELGDHLKAHIVLEVSEHPDPLVRANNGGPRPLTVDEHLLQTRPDLVERVLSHVVAVGDWAEQHPAEAAAFIARQGGVSLDAVHRAYKGRLHKLLHTTLDETSIAGIEAYKNFLFEAEFLPADFEVHAWIAAEPLAALQRRETKLVA